MAISPKDRYPGQIDTSDLVGYPRGKAQNIDSPGDGTGTPWEQDLCNDIFGLQQALLAQAGITPSGTPDKVGASQYLQAVQTVADQRIAPHFNASGEVVLPLAQTYKIFIPAGKAFDEDATPDAANWTNNVALDRRSVVNGATLSFDLAPGIMLPRKAVITRVYALVTPGQARTGNDRMKLEIGYGDFGSAASPALTTFAEWRSSYGVDATQAAAFQWLFLDLTGGLDLMFIETYDVVMARVKASSLNADTFIDRCHGLHVEYQCDVIQPGG